MKVYISGKMTGLSKRKNTKEVQKDRKEISQERFFCFEPGCFLLFEKH